MNKQVFNPYLPINEYIPDGEPHIFENRIYIYGSHDKENGDKFCMLPYVTYSAPVDDLSDWRYEGEIYTNINDPNVTENRKYMYAPDVVKGNDGKYYLFYSLEGYGENYVNDGVISVARSDSPSGRFEYWGDVRNPDGTQFKQFCMFDPAVLNDDGKIYLYYGAGSLDSMAEISESMLEEAEKKMHGLSFTQMTGGKYKDHTYLGGNVVELEEDMLTVKGDAKRIVPDCLEAKIRYPEFIGHGFFEASSIRKFNGKYYFIYSSERSHDLVYATSDYPDRDFVYRGILVSNGDIGLNGRSSNDATRKVGNNHGSIEYINGKYYIFYHRHTNQTEFSRQACAEEIIMNEDGLFEMVEGTSCGLNNGPLIGKGSYPAVIACVLKGKGNKNSYLRTIKSDVPYITCIDDERIITNVTDDALIGYKYFTFNGKTSIALTVRGNADGVVKIYSDETKTNQMAAAELQISGQEWNEMNCSIDVTGKSALFLHFDIKGSLDIKEISMS